MSNQNIVARRCDKFMAFCFYALIYFLPISIALSETFINLALVTYFIKRIALFFSGVKSQEIKIKGKSFFGKIGLFFTSLKPKSSWLSAPIALVLLSSIISILFSQYRGLSISGFFGKTLQNAFIFFTFVECINTKKRLKIFLITFFASCTLICINGLFQYFFGHGFIHGHAFDGQISSCLRQANDFGSYLVIVTPVLFCLSVFILNGIKEKISKEKSGFSFFSSLYVKIVIVVVFLLALACLGLTYSRGAWLSFVVSIVLLSLNNWKRFALAMVFILGFVLLFAPGMFEARPSIGTFHEFLINNNRLLYWRGAVEIIKDYPLVGAGLNTYSRVRSQYEIMWGGYPHNCYLQMLAEVGSLGFVAFLWMLFCLFKGALQSVKRMDILSLKVLFIGFVVGFAAFIFHAFWDTTFYSVQLSSLMWVILGVIVSIEKVCFSESDA